MHIARPLVWFCMVQFWACMVKSLTCMYFHVLKIAVGPTILSCIPPVFVAHGFLLAIRRYVNAWYMHIGFTCHTLLLGPLTSVLGWFVFFSLWLLGFLCKGC